MERKIRFATQSGGQPTGDEWLARAKRLEDIGYATLSMPDHANHIHVGYRPMLGDNKKLGQAAAVVLKPGQWNNLIDRLRKLSNPVVPTSPSKFAIPATSSAKKSKKK